LELITAPFACRSSQSLAHPSPCQHPIPEIYRGPTPSLEPASCVLSDSPVEMGLIHDCDLDRISLLSAIRKSNLFGSSGGNATKKSSL
jgi:hypothetical protein